LQQPTKDQLVVIYYSRGNAAIATFARLFSRLCCSVF